MRILIVLLSKTIGKRLFDLKQARSTVARKRPRMIFKKIVISKNLEFRIFGQFQNLEFKILAFQNLEFGILTDSKILNSGFWPVPNIQDFGWFQNLEFGILALPKS